MRNVEPASPAGGPARRSLGEGGPTFPGRRADNVCEERHRPLRSFVWQLFGGFVIVVLTLALAAAGHMTLKADADDVKLIEARTRELEGRFGQIRSDLGALRAGQDHVQEELRYIRQLLDEERKK